MIDSQLSPDIVSAATIISQLRPDIVSTATITCQLSHDMVSAVTNGGQLRHGIVSAAMIACQLQSQIHISRCSERIYPVQGDCQPFKFGTIMEPHHPCPKTYLIIYPHHA